MSTLPPILILHNRYLQTGGEEAVVQAEAALLRSAGHTVILREWTNEGLTGVTAKLRTFSGANGSGTAARWLDAELQATGARIVHVHNFFPRLSPAIHHLAAQRGCAVIQTLHNYRLLCAAATFLRDGAVCEKCLHHGRHWGVVHRCYRSSIPGSIASVRMQRATAGSPRWMKSVHRFIALSDFARAKLLEGGLPADRTAVKGNFLHSPLADAKAGDAQEYRRTGALYVGRLSSEKGIDQLVAAWRAAPDLPLTIAGTGPLEAHLKQMAPNNVTFLGHCTPAQVADQMASALMLLMPSIWYEGFPLTMLEGFASRLPIIASDIGSLTEIAGHGRHAQLVPPGDGSAMARAAIGLSRDVQERLRMADSAHAVYRAQYSPAANLAQLEAIYCAALAEAGAGTDAVEATGATGS